ncbi:MAG: hypothetical protein Q7S00_01965 [bacterium]|nr:hypothetical protein [bacterium]
MPSLRADRRRAKQSYGFRGVAASLTLLAMTFVSCQTNLFPAVGSGVSAPIAVAMDTVNNRAYLINSNLRLEFADNTLMVLDTTAPASPILVNTVTVPNFSGQPYLDVANRKIYLPVRESDNRIDTTDALYQIDVNEAGGSFLGITPYDAGSNPFGTVCCDSSSRFFVITYGGELLRFDPANLASETSLNFDVTLSTGENIQGIGATEAAIIGDQAFVTTRAGEIFVTNLTELGAGSNAVDYVIHSSQDLRGIATNGTLLYVVNGTAGSEALLVIDPATLTASAAATTTEVAIDTVTKTTITLASGTNPNEVVYFATLNELYVSQTSADTVAVIDAAAETLTTSITLSTGSFTSDEPFGLNTLTSGGTDYLYVTNLRSDNVSIINLSTRAVVATYP